MILAEMAQDVSGWWVLAAFIIGAFYGMISWRVIERIHS